MAEELKAGCARPTGGPVGETVPEQAPEKETAEKEVMNMIQVGKKRRILMHPAIKMANSLM